MEPSLTEVLRGLETRSYSVGSIFDFGAFQVQVLDADHYQLDWGNRQDTLKLPLVPQSVQDSK